MKKTKLLVLFAFLFSWQISHASWTITRTAPFQTVYNQTVYNYIVEGFFLNEESALAACQDFMRDVVKPEEKYLKCGNKRYFVTSNDNDDVLIQSFGNIPANGGWDVHRDADYYMMVMRIPRHKDIHLDDRGCDAKKKRLGNPCYIASGNKYQQEVDWRSSTNPLLQVARTYNSLHSKWLGGWQLNYDSGIEFGRINSDKLQVWKYELIEQAITEPDTIGKISLGDGSVDLMSPVNGQWFIQNAPAKVVSHDETHFFILDKKTGQTRTYNKQGQIQRIEDANGHYVQFSYTNNIATKVTDNFGDSLTYNYQNGGVSSITLPNGKQITYTYDAEGRLSSVTRPGYGTKTYVYDEADKAPNDNKNLLTGIIDENGKRYATYAYDLQDRGILTEHAYNSQRFELTYYNNYLCTRIFSKNSIT